VEDKSTHSFTTVMDGSAVVHDLGLLAAGK